MARLRFRAAEHSAVAAIFRRAGLLCLPAVLACAAAACSGGDSERPRELEERLDRIEQLLAGAGADPGQEADSGKDRIAELEAELDRTERQLQQVLDASSALLELGVVDSTLRTVINRGRLLCGVKQTQPLFGNREADGSAAGFDIEFCKAIAAAVLGDADAVDYVDASHAASRYKLLADGKIDVLIRTTAITASRDRDLGVDFAQPTFYAGQGFAVRRDSGIAQIRDLEGKVICVTLGAQEWNLDHHFGNLRLFWRKLALSGSAGASGPSPVWDLFFNGLCDALTADVSDLASWISVRDDADDYTVLREVISREPFAPGVRDYDSEWKDVVNWVVRGLIAAEEMGITSRNVDSMAGSPPSWEAARLLGAWLGGAEVAPLVKLDSVDAQFIRRAIRAVGNYGEIYDRTIGGVIPRACTLNALWNEDKRGCPPGTGGILYAPTYR